MSTENAFQEIRHRLCSPTYLVSHPTPTRGELASPLRSAVGKFSAQDGHNGARPSEGPALKFEVSAFAVAEELLVGETSFVEFEEA